MDNRNLDGILWSKTASGYWHSYKYGYQHVYVYEKLTGCKVFDWQVVHHLDRDKENNTAENLVCMSESDHRYFHGVTQPNEKRRRISESMKGKQNSLGVIPSNETRQKMSNTRRRLPPSTRNKSGFKGVSWNARDKNWRARCKGYFIGYFLTPEEAARAYDAKARELWGDNAYQNMKAV